MIGQHHEWKTHNIYNSLMRCKTRHFYLISHHNIPYDFYSFPFTVQSLTGKSLWVQWAYSQVSIYRIATLVCLFGKDQTFIEMSPCLKCHQIWYLQPWANQYGLLCGMFMHLGNPFSHEKFSCWGYALSSVQKAAIVSSECLGFDSDE